MTPLERELIDLGDHLDHGDGDGIAGVVRARVESTRHRSLPARAPARVALAAAVVLALVLSVSPARRAVARLLGIGGVEIRPVPTTALAPGITNPPGGTVPGAPTPPTPPPTTASPGPATTASGAPAATGTAIAPDAPLPTGATFAIRKAGSAWGPLRRVDTDDRVPGGLVALVYDRFTLVELASGKPDYPVVGKLAPPGVTVDFTTVGEAGAVWLQGAHEVAYLTPDGQVRQDTVRRAGSVLVWATGGVTYRVEGLDRMSDALLVAASLR